MEESSSKGGEGGPFGLEIVRQRDRVAARLPRDVADWYRGLGGGNFSKGLVEAYWRAKVTRPSAAPGAVPFDVGKAVGALLPGWRIRAQQRIADRDHLAWIRGRLNGKFPGFIVGRERDVLAALRSVT